MSVIGLEALDDFIHGRRVVVFEAATERVGQKFFGQRAVKFLAMIFGENFFQVFHVLKRFAGHQLAGGVHGISRFVGAPQAEGVEIFQREAERVHARVA